jgi:uncharacterized protein
VRSEAGGLWIVDRDTNTGEPLNRHRRLETATQTIRHDANHPSRIVLPVIPGE